MAPKEYLTREEAKSLKNEIKLEITKEDTERRHDDRSKLNGYYFTVDELEKSNIKLTMTMENLNNDVSEIKQMMKEMKLSIENLPGKFVSKDEHAENRERIKALEAEVKIAQSKVQSIDLKIAGYGGAIAILAFIVPFIFDKLTK